MWSSSKKHSQTSKSLYSASVHPSIARARWIANLLDSALTIPLIRKKIGLDALLGFLPVGGDVVSAILALYVVYVGYEVGLPPKVLIRMGINTLFDLLVGLIPVVGDVTDAWIPSNQWNLKLLEEAYLELQKLPAEEQSSKKAQKTVTVDVVAVPVS